MTHDTPIPDDLRVIYQSCEPQRRPEMKLYPADIRELIERIARLESQLATERKDALTEIRDLIEAHDYDFGPIKFALDRLIDPPEKETK